jgi:hypothetical protein
MLCGPPARPRCGWERGTPPRPRPFDCDCGCGRARAGPRLRPSALPAGIRHLPSPVRLRRRGEAGGEGSRRLAIELRQRGPLPSALPQFCGEDGGRVAAGATPHLRSGEWPLAPGRRGDRLDTFGDDVEVQLVAQGDDAGGDSGVAGVGVDACDEAASIFCLYMHPPEAMRLRSTIGLQGSRPRKAKGARHNGGRTRGARFRTPEGSYLSFL